MSQTNKYFRIPYEKEVIDTAALADKIKEEKWINSSTILVNCNPYYSSALSQMLNHKLSHLNKNELFECIPLEMPYPNMAQVWDPAEREYKLYIRYLADWVKDNISTSSNYLFISSDVSRWQDFSKLRTSIRGNLDESNYRFASLYLQEGGNFLPDYYVEKFNYDRQGDVLFQWENMDNPNFKNKQ